MGYTNSKLVTYTNISPNKNSPRNHKIDTITIHCMATQWTAKQCCDYFAKSSAKASANYCVGKDGSIGLSVAEKDRSWCSSSGANDNRAITIEVASNSAHPYAVNAKAYNALIDLVTDICERNGISKLLWKADKSLIGDVSQQNMTVHRWFANKACPGKYLYDRMGAIADSVNERLGNSTSITVKSDYDEYIWEYFLDKIGNEYGVAGLMGNLYAESGLYPDRLQGDVPYSEKSQLYTEGVDSGAISESEFVHSGNGYGLAQWTYYTRKQALYNMYVDGGYYSIGDIDLACDYLWHELENDFSDVLSVLCNASSVREASDAVLHDFESPADQSESVEEAREDFGLYYYSKFAQGIVDIGNENWNGIKLPKKLSLLLLSAVIDDI